VFGDSLELEAWHWDARFPHSRVTIQSATRQDPRMITKNLGMLLLGIYLILVGIISLIPGLAIPGIITGILALVAGILILLGK